MSDTHKYVGSHPQDLDGRMLAPGDTFAPTKEQLETASMVGMLDEGNVITLEKASTPKGGEDK